jgi:hypothetical protein
VALEELHQKPAPPQVFQKRPLNPDKPAILEPAMPQGLEGSLQNCVWYPTKVLNIGMEHVLRA